MKTTYVHANCKENFENIENYKNVNYNVIFQK